MQTPSAGTVTRSSLPVLTVLSAVDLSVPANIQVQISLGTTVSAPEGWDGTSHMPTVQDANSTVTPTSVTSIIIEEEMAKKSWDGVYITHHMRNGCLHGIWR
ncbi:hypothetical protein [Desulfosporosinus lacus]|uniref:hypothetical protein n=1 Tax=Desulfosporosinus lacus TaxID=329936 RepID=UPI0009346586|nr:hypothetical protein [Desulfosporosinus lacus]